MDTNNWWAVDCETDPFDGEIIPTPFIWGARHCSGEYLEFSTTEDFIGHFRELKTTIYAHNGGKFDWHYVTPHINDGSSVLIIAGRLSKFKIGDCEFRDSYNILPFPLSMYKKDDFDYSLLTKENRVKHMGVIKDYLYNDCKYLAELLTKFFDTYPLGLTVAGIALKLYETQYGDKIERTDLGYYNKYNKYYYGGRVECFEVGELKGKYKVIDINSAYPDVMRNNIHPIGTKTVVLGSVKGLSNGAIARSMLIVKCKSFGGFAVRKDKGGIFFPADGVEREHFVTGHEFLACKHTGHVSNSDVVRCETWIESLSFVAYVDHFYELKSSSKKMGDRAGELFAKLLLNSLYGKFASNPARYKELKVGVIEDVNEMFSRFDFTLNSMLGESKCVYERPLPEGEYIYYNVVTASSITGAVRAKMWLAMCECGGLIYCDTDCIVARDTGNLELDPIKLGAWDVEAECDGGGVAGKKLYVFNKVGGGHKYASKGVRLSPTEIFSVAKGATITYKPQAPTYSFKNGIKFTNRIVKSTF